MWTYTTDSMDFVTVSTGLILPYWMGLPIRYIHDGINTVLHPLNSNLSGGEKQKIGIIRALLSKANVLVFDEPTSALDKESSRFFQQCINKIENKIIIIISHDDLEYLESKEKKVFLI